MWRAQWKLLTHLKEAIGCERLPPKTDPRVHRGLLQENHGQSEEPSTPWWGRGAALTGLFLLTYWQLECYGHIQEILADDIKITCKAKPHFLQHSVSPRKNMKMDILQTSDPWIILFTDPAHLETTTADTYHANQAHCALWHSTRVSGLAPFPSGK